MATGLKFMDLLQEKAGEAGADEVEDSGKGILTMMGKTILLSFFLYLDNIIIIHISV